jgi:hypothetical protein
MIAKTAVPTIERILELRFTCRERVQIVGVLTVLLPGSAHPDHDTMTPYDTIFVLEPLTCARARTRATGSIGKMLSYGVMVSYGSGKALISFIPKIRVVS